MKQETTIINAATATASGGTASGSFSRSDDLWPEQGDWEFTLYVDGGANATNVDLSATKQIASATEDFPEASATGLDLSGTGETFKLDAQEAEQLDITFTNQAASGATVSAYLVIQEK